MTQKQSPLLELRLQQIADMLVLNGTLTECPGLVHGKMGIAIFFFHYAKFTNNMLFADYAMDVLNEIQEQIHVSSPADYENGIAGIGVGFDYLIRNKFLLVKEDICEDFDERMYRAVMYDPWQDFSKYDGLIGYGRFWMMRLYNQKASKVARDCLLCIIKWIEEYYLDISEEIQLDVYCFLYDLQKIFGFTFNVELLQKCQKWSITPVGIDKSFSRLSHSTVGNVIRTYQYNHYIDTRSNNLKSALQRIPDIDMDKVPVSMGLLNGFAGEGLLRLTVLDTTNVLWMQLL